MRAPFDDACRPSPASITPAFTISSLNFPMAWTSSMSGMAPDSLVAFAFTIIMNFIVVSSSLSVRFLVIRHRPDLGCHLVVVAHDIDVQLQELASQFLRLIERRGLHDRVATDHFLGFGERAVGKGDL